MNENENLIMPCGDNCAYCPLHLAQTDEDLRRAAEIWFKLGTTKELLTAENIRCYGCETRHACSVKKCIKRRGVEKCVLCPDFPCEMISPPPEKAEEHKKKYREICTDAEYEMYCKAFFEKEANLRKQI